MQSQMKEKVDPPVMAYGSKEASRTIQHKHHSEKIDNTTISEMPPIVINKSKIKAPNGFNSSLGTKQ